MPDEACCIAEKRGLQMPGRLKKIVDYVKDHSVLKNLSLASMRLLVEEDVTLITEDTPDDPEKERKLLEAAKIVLRKDKLDINF